MLRSVRSAGPTRSALRFRSVARRSRSRGVGLDVSCGTLLARRDTWRRAGTPCTSALRCTQLGLVVHPPLSPCQQHRMVWRRDVRRSRHPPLDSSESSSLTRHKRGAMVRASCRGNTRRTPGGALCQQTTITHLVTTRTRSRWSTGTRTKSATSARRNPLTDSRASPGPGAPQVPPAAPGPPPPPTFPLMWPDTIFCGTTHKET